MELMSQNSSKVREIYYSLDKRKNEALLNSFSKQENKKLIFDLFESFEDWYNSRSFMYLKSIVDDKYLEQLIKIKDQKKTPITPVVDSVLNSSNGSK